MHRRRAIGTGFAALDAQLPGGGLPAGAVIEVLSDGLGTGAWTLALRAAIHAVTHGQPISTDAKPASECRNVSLERLVIVDGQGDLYPPAVVAMGLPADRLMVIRPRQFMATRPGTSATRRVTGSGFSRWLSSHKQMNPQQADVCWAVQQVLGCRSVGAVVATGLILDDVHSRRLQLAAERSGALVVIVSPATHRNRHRPTFAGIQLRVEAMPVIRDPTSKAGNRPPWDSSVGVDVGVGYGFRRRCRVTVLKVREGRPVGPVVVDLSDETFDVPLHSVSADRAAAFRQIIA